MLEGRVVENAVLETIKSNKKDAAVVVLAIIFILFKITLSVIGNVPFVAEDDLAKVTLSIAAVSFISLIGLFITYLDIKKHRLIAWDPRKPGR